MKKSFTWLIILAISLSVSVELTEAEKTTTISTDKKKVDERKRIRKLNRFAKKYIKTLKKEYKKNIKKQQLYTEKLIENADKCINTEKGSLALSMPAKKVTSSAKKSINYQKKYQKLRGTLKKAIKREIIPVKPETEIPIEPKTEVPTETESEISAPVETEAETAPVPVKTEVLPVETKTEVPAEAEAETAPVPVKAETETAPIIEAETTPVEAEITPAEAEVETKTEDISPEKYLNEGIKLYKNGDYFSAREKFKQVIKLDKDNNKARKWLRKTDRAIIKSKMKK